MPWKIAGDYLVNAETGRKVNKKPMPRARLERLQRALYANVPEARKAKIKEAVELALKEGNSAGAKKGWQHRKRGPSAETPDAKTFRSGMKRQILNDVLWEGPGEIPAAFMRNRLYGPEMGNPIHPRLKIPESVRRRRQEKLLRNSIWKTMMAGGMLASGFGAPLVVPLAANAGMDAITGLYYRKEAPMPDITIELKEYFATAFKAGNSAGAKKGWRSRKGGGRATNARSIEEHFKRHPVLSRDAKLRSQYRAFLRTASPADRQAHLSQLWAEGGGSTKEALAEYFSIALKSGTSSGAKKGWKSRLAHGFRQHSPEGRKIISGDKVVRAGQGLSRGLNKKIAGGKKGLKKAFAQHSSGGKKLTAGELKKLGKQTKKFLGSPRGKKILGTAVKVGALAVMYGASRAARHASSPAYNLPKVGNSYGVSNWPGASKESIKEAFIQVYKEHSR